MHPPCHLTCFSVPCISLKLIVRSRGLIEFKFNMFLQSYFIDSVACFEMGVLSYYRGLSGWAQFNHKSLFRREAWRARISERDVTMEAEVRVMQGHEPGMYEAPRNRKRQGTDSLPRVSRRNTALLTHFRLLSSRNVSY